MDVNPKNMLFFKTVFQRESGKSAENIVFMIIIKIRASLV